ncbi:MAG: presenilin family intramembrane aspartyl protease [archaeon]
MFLITQFIGLYVVNHYSSTKIIDGVAVDVSAPELPLGLESPKIEKESDYRNFFYGIIFAFILAISILFLLTKFNAEFILKLWFFIVVIIALIVSFIAVLPKFQYSLIMVVLIALPLAFVKIYKKGFIVHNITELFIYPGIAAVFVPILNMYTIIALLVLISIYDAWAVWHSGIMQKMAKYQINKLNVFSGFFVPYAEKKVRDKIKKMKEKFSKKELEKKKIKINIAILGGGDVIFPIIAAGVVLKSVQNMSFGLKPFVGGFYPALFVIAGATLGVGYLFLFSEKKKFYPAMPFITAGILLGMVLSYLIF